MVEAHPIEGVGAGNFGSSSLHYLARPGILRTATEIVQSPKVAHNLYLSFLAEFGVVGLSLFMIVVVGSVAAGIKAAREFARLHDTSMEILTRTTVVALISLLAAVFFLSDQFDKWLWLLLGTGPALLAIARRSRAAEPGAVS
jgi:O-antigen ligase